MYMVQTLSGRNSAVVICLSVPTSIYRSHLTPSVPSQASADGDLSGLTEKAKRGDHPKEPKTLCHE